MPNPDSVLPTPHTHAPPQITTPDGATLVTLERPPCASLLSTTMPPMHVMVNSEPFATINQN